MMDFAYKPKVHIDYNIYCSLALINWDLYIIKHKME